MRAVAVQVRELDPATLEYHVVAEFDPREGATGGAEQYRDVRAAGDTRYRVTSPRGRRLAGGRGLRAADF